MGLKDTTYMRRRSSTYHTVIYVWLQCSTLDGNGVFYMDENIAFSTNFMFQMIPWGPQIHPFHCNASQPIIVMLASFYG